MKDTLLKLCLRGLFIGVVLSAGAQAAQQPSCASIQKSLAGGSSADAVIRTVVESGMSLADATVYALVCVGEENPEAIATAGIEAAGNLPQAQSVATAVLATTGETGPVAEAVRAAMHEYTRRMPQPDVYQDKYTPTGGDQVVSPAA